MYAVFCLKHNHKLNLILFPEQLPYFSSLKQMSKIEWTLIQSGIQTDTPLLPFQTFPLDLSSHFILNQLEANTWQ